MFLLFFTIPIFFPASLHAENKLGQLKVEEVNLKPRLRVYEPQSGGFEVGESTVALSYYLEPYFKAVVRLGDRALINTPSYFFDTSVTQEDQLGLVESYAALDGRFGEFRMGMIPLNVGFHGAQSESETVLPRPMLFSKKVAALRDLGMSYEVLSEKFLTQFSVHNGEAGKNKDGRIWITGKWAYVESLYNFGFYGQVGETTNSSTSTSVETRGAFDPTKKTKLRLGGIYLQSQFDNINSLFEYYFGEVDFDSKTQGQFAGGVLQVDFSFHKKWHMYMRLDVYDPLRAVEKNRETHSAVGFSYSSEYKNSVFSIVAVKKEEDVVNVQNDELLLTWKLSP